MPTKAKPTPGPWSIDGRDIRGFFGGTIATMADREMPGTALEADANATLIASAPTLAAENAALREVLAAILNAPGTLRPLLAARETARAILAKP